MVWKELTKRWIGIAGEKGKIGDRWENISEIKSTSHNNSFNAKDKGMIYDKEKLSLGFDPE